MRALSGSLLAGTDIYVNAIIALDGPCYHLKGFGKLRIAHRAYAAVMSLATRAPETLMREMMKDDRLARRPRFYEQILSDAMQATTCISMYVYL